MERYFNTYIYEKNAKSNWIMAYGDMITLLICFFVIMLVLREGDISVIHGWVNDRLNNAMEELKQNKITFKNEKWKITRSSQGVVIIINDPVMFKEGSDIARDGLTRNLNELSDSLKSLEIFGLEQNEIHANIFKEFENNDLEWNVEIRVEGHTDNTPIRNGYIFKNNWELSSARAQTIMQMIQNRTGFKPLMFAVAGYGSNIPIGDNNTIAGRGLNRRVEIIINAFIVKKQMKKLG